MPRLLLRSSPRFCAPAARLASLVIALSSGGARADAGCPAGTQKKTHSEGGLVAEYCVDPQGRLHGDAYTHLPSGERINDDHWDHGAKVGVWTEFYPSGKKKSEVRYVAGKREGDYAEWSPKGQPLTLGRFAGDREVGPWLFAREGDPSELSFAVFERGLEISGKLLDHGPSDCKQLAALSVDAKRGFVASVALLSILRLPETTRSKVTDWWKIGLCVREGSVPAAGELEAACGRGVVLSEQGPAVASQLAARCVGPIAPKAKR